MSIMNSSDVYRKWAIAAETALGYTYAERDESQHYSSWGRKLRFAKQNTCYKTGGSRGYQTGWTYILHNALLSDITGIWLSSATTSSVTWRRLTVTFGDSRLVGKHSVQRIVKGSGSLISQLTQGCSRAEAKPGSDDDNRICEHRTTNCYFSVNLMQDSMSLISDFDIFFNVIRRSSHVNTSWDSQEGKLRVAEVSPWNVAPIILILPYLWKTSSILEMDKSKFFGEIRSLARSNTFFGTSRSDLDSAPMSCFWHGLPTICICGSFYRRSSTTGSPSWQHPAPKNERTSVREEN